jgi:hypothetical protein
LNGATVKITGVGTCQINADQAGNDTYNAAPTVAQSFVINPAPQAIQFRSDSNAVVGVDMTLQANGGNSGNPVTFSGSGACSVNGATLSFSAAGTCTVTANQAGNANYAAAAPVSATIMVNNPVIEPEPQNLSLSFSSPDGIVGNTLSVNVTPGESGNAVSLSSSTPAVCSLASNSVTLLAPGICTVSAAQDGNADYEAASATTSLAVKTNKAQFAMTVASTKDSSGALTTVSQLDTVNIGLNITAAPADVGSDAEVYLTSEFSGSYFILTEQGWTTWDGASWQRAKTLNLTGAAQKLPVFSGQLPLSGTLNFSAAYGYGGQISQGPVAVGSLTVTVPNAVETAKDECAGVYYNQQCHNVSDLGNGISGALYTAENGVAQQVSLACRLGKPVTVLVRISPAAADVGTAAEVVLGFVSGDKIYQSDGEGFGELIDVAQLSGKPLGALPAAYSAALFSGELPAQGEWNILVGYRTVGANGVKGDLQLSATALQANAAAESCEQPGLQLNTRPLGSGKGEVLSKVNDDGSVRLVAIPAADGSQFEGWTGDAAGCAGKAATLTITPNDHQFTCQPKFTKWVLGTENCINGQDPKYGACCNLNDEDCPLLPPTCDAPLEDQWFLGTISSIFVNNSLILYSDQETAYNITVYGAQDNSITLGATAQGTLAAMENLRLALPGKVFSTSERNFLLQLQGAGVHGQASFLGEPYPQLSANPRVKLIIDLSRQKLSLFNRSDAEIIVGIRYFTLPGAASSVASVVSSVTSPASVASVASVSGVDKSSGTKTIPLPSKKLVSFEVSTLLRDINHTLEHVNRLEVIHPDPAQRCTGKVLVGLQVRNFYTGTITQPNNW